MVAIGYRAFISPQSHMARPNVSPKGSTLAGQANPIDRFSSQTHKVAHGLPREPKAIPDRFPVAGCKLSILNPQALDTGLIHQISAMVKRAQDSVGEIQSADSASDLEEFIISRLRLNTPDLLGVVVKNDQGRVIAYSELLFPMPDSQVPVGVLNLLYVDPDYQKQGIGTWMLKNTLQHARNLGTIEQLDLSASNPHAIWLYQKFGFRYTPYWMNNPAVNLLEHLGVDVAELGRFEWVNKLFARFGPDWRQHYTVHSEDMTQSQDVYQLSMALN